MVRHRSNLRNTNVRARDKIKIKTVTVLSPHVICGGTYDVISPAVLLEVVIPLDGTIFNVVTKMKDPIEKVYTQLYLNDILQETDGTGLKVKEGDVVKVTLVGDDIGMNLANSASVSIAILPKYDKRFLMKQKEDAPDEGI